MAPEGPEIARAPEVDDAVVFARSTVEDSLRQGEILSGVISYGIAYGDRGEPDGLAPIRHPYCLIMSQDCDLDQDCRAFARGSRKHALLDVVLLCPMESETVIQDGAGLGTGELWKQALQNKNERYSLIRSVSASVDQIGSGIPRLMIDFKKYFTIPTEELYRQLQPSTAGGAQRRCYLRSPYREHIQHRFVNYLARVEVPVAHHV